MNISASLKGKIISRVTNFVRENPGLHIVCSFIHNGVTYTIVEVKYGVCHVYAQLDKCCYEVYVCTYRFDGDKVSFSISPHIGEIDFSTQE